MSPSAALDRDALYYPFIHVRDVGWLKATLLCFPNVRRIVPNNYVLVEQPEIQEFCETEGPRGKPLLSSADLYSDAVRGAQEVLLQKMQGHEETLRSRYSQRSTLGQYGTKADQFQIHREKMIHGLTSYLETTGLAWNTRETLWRTRSASVDQTAHPQTIIRSDPYEWLTVHPTLGGAIMATLAIAIAQDCGLDIVTDSAPAHYAVASKDQNHVFEALLGDVLPVPPGTEDMVDDLAEVVIRTTFDVTRLNAKQIAGLLKDGKDLCQFKTVLASVAATIPPITNPKEREERLRYGANLVVENWKKYKRSLPRFALDAISDAAEIKFPELGSMALTGAVTQVQLGWAAGISVSLLTYAGFKVWRKYKEQSKNPYQYLTRISQAVSAVTFPPLPSLLPS